MESLRGKLDASDDERKRQNGRIDNRLSILEGNIEILINEHRLLQKECNEVFAKLLSRIDFIGNTVAMMKDSSEGQVQELDAAITKKLAVMDGTIEKMQDKISLDVKESSSNIMDLIKENSEGAQRKMSDLHSQGILELQGYIDSVQKSEDVVLENVGVMNHTIQEMIRDIMALDEGNRLIIAKMLLQDMEG